MANNETQKLPFGPAGALKRPVYQEGNYLAHLDLCAEQRYLLQRLRRHNRYLHGWGVACGLHVVPGNDPRRPWLVRVCHGYAIGPYGDEIRVEAAVLVDVADYLWTQPLDILPAPSIAYVGIQYDEQKVEPVSVRLPACGCNETYEFSRIHEGFRVDILWSLPAGSNPPVVNLCKPGTQPCPNCPEIPQVLPASIILPVSQSGSIPAQRIDNFSFRRSLD